ncbi:MAG: SPOR domain-containing protein [Betaproteobacteria bacterium]
MSRDKKTSSSRKSGGGTLVGMFIGLVLGVCIAAGAVWYINRAHSPFINNKPATPAATAPAAAPAKPGTAPQPLPLPGKPGDPVNEKRFQFYDILPGKSEAVPDKPDAAKPEARKEESKKDEGKKDEAKKSDPKKEELKQPIFFQAGSFSSAQDADNQKAKLALMGMEANILQVMVQDKTYYRVQLGPFRTMDEANKARAELAKAGIDASLVKKEQ